jgi:hypothetical protein
VVHTVVDCDLRQFERVDAFETPDIETVLPRIGPPLVMGVDTTRRAKEVLGGLRVELIEAEAVRTFGDP